MYRRLLSLALACVLGLVAIAVGTIGWSQPAADSVLMPISAGQAAASVGQYLHGWPKQLDPPPAPTTVPAVPRAVRPAGTPAWITISSVGISESVKPQGLNSQGELIPPPGQVIWFDGTPLPGAIGNSLIAGHDEWNGPSNFWNLNEVTAGQSILVRYSSGQSLHFVITNGKSELKTAVQNDASIWQSQNDFAELIVITCDKYSPVVDHHHLSNYIVYAKLVG